MTIRDNVNAVHEVLVAQLGVKHLRAVIALLPLLSHRVVVRELTLNGAKAGDDLLSPGWSKYDKTCLYDTRDITAQLQSGTNNAIGLILGNSFYNVTAGYGRYVKFQQSFGPLRAIVQIQLDYTNGTSQIIGSDATWQTGPGAITFENVYATLGSISRDVVSRHRFARRQLRRRPKTTASRRHPR